jgi:hypothetical protein
MYLMWLSSSLLCEMAAIVGLHAGFQVLKFGENALATYFPFTEIKGQVYLNSGNMTSQKLSRQTSCPVYRLIRHDSSNLNRDSVGFQFAIG